MKYVKPFYIILLSLSFLYLSQTINASEIAFSSARKEVSETTEAVYERFLSKMDVNEAKERHFALKSLISSPKTLEIFDSSGKLVWTQEDFGFLESSGWNLDAVHPSLWHNASLNHIYGLFEVTEQYENISHRIFQVRGFDLANMTFIESDDGWIIIDPLTSNDTAEAALDLVNESLGKKEIAAVVISHSHADHFAGIEGIIREEQVMRGEKDIQGTVAVIAPEDFMKYAVSENIYAGTAMKRRAEYQFGSFLPKDEKGLVSSGLGMELSEGVSSLILPSKTIIKTGQEITIGGVKMIFQLTPGAEAPSDMNIYFPEQKAIFLADNCVPCLHNLYTLRGAEVRDALEWTNYLIESLEMFGDDFEIAFQGHNWPRWGNREIKDFIIANIQVYRYIHDQTLHYANMGYTSEEIAEMLEIPDALEKKWYIRPNYGTVSSNVKGVYQKYLGWYDGNPVNLNPLPEAVSAKKYVEYMGGSEEIIKKAYLDFQKGEYRWASEVLYKIVLAEPSNLSARLLCADALEQLGYQAESGIWRNEYLSGAYELRNGTFSGGFTKQGNNGIKKNMTAQMIFEYLGIMLKGKAAENISLAVDIELTDTGEAYQLVLQNGTLIAYPAPGPKIAGLSLGITKNSLFYLIMKSIPPKESLIFCEGDPTLLNTLFDMLETFPDRFSIMENRMEKNQE